MAEQRVEFIKAGIWHGSLDEANAILAAQPELLLVESGKLTSDSLSLMLIRKIDWHDAEGVRYLLAHGAEANRPWGRSHRPLHHALARRNGPEMIALLLDHGADPRIADEKDGLTAIARDLDIPPS